MFTHTERMGTSSFEQLHNRSYSFLMDLFAILTGCWLAGTVLSLSYHTTAEMQLGLSMTTYLILSSRLSGMLLTVMHAESARSVIHLRALTITYVVLMIIISPSLCGCGRTTLTDCLCHQHPIIDISFTERTPTAATSRMHCQRRQCCTKTVFTNQCKLINHQPPDGLYTIQGVGGIITATGMGDFPLAVRVGTQKARFTRA
jgi:hypothetical protein